LAISQEFGQSVDWLLTGKTHAEPKTRVTGNSPRSGLALATDPLPQLTPGSEWVVKNSLSRNSQKLHGVRMLYKRLSLFG
jgi:hypothetical protein